MKVLFLAAAAAPLTKVGSLGHASETLPRALADLGHEVRVVVPFDGQVDRARLSPRLVARFDVPHFPSDQTARVYAQVLNGVSYNLVAGPPILRKRRLVDDNIHTDGAAFTFTALAALGLCRALDWMPDIVHGVDGRMSPALYWLDTDGRHDPQFQRTASVLSFNDLAATTLSAGRALHDFGLAPSDAPLLPDEAREQFLALGLAHADMLHMPNTATAGAEHERRGLGPLLAARQERLRGIPYGLDLTAWNPRRDKHLAARYDAASLDRRASNKRALQKALGLPRAPATPLVALLDADGPELDIALPALRALLAGPEPVQLLLLATERPAAAPALRQFAKEFPERAGLALKAGAAAVHQAYGGADVVLSPSIRPGAQTHLIALRYGAVPVVGDAGLPVEAVVDDEQAWHGSGFVFRGYNSSALLAGLQRALYVLRRPKHWRALQRRGMRQAEQWAWARFAPACLALYQQAIIHRKEAVTTLTHALADDSAWDTYGQAGSGLVGAGRAKLP